MAAAVAIVGGAIAARRWRLAAAVCCGLAVGLAPVVLRNVAVAGELSAVSSHGGLNFYIGNNPEANGAYRGVPGISPTIQGQRTDAGKVAEQATGRSLSDAEVSSYFYGRAWTWIRSQPARAAALFLKKLAYVFNSTSVWLNDSYNFFSRDAGTLLRLMVVGPWLLLPLGIFGLAIAVPATDRREYIVWTLFVPAYAVAVAVFFVSDRYRLPLLVPLSGGAGAAIDRALAWWRERRFDAWRPVVALLVPLAVLCNWPLGGDDGRAEERTRMAERLITMGRYAEADEWAAQAEPIYPRPSVMHVRVGRFFLGAKQYDRALAHFERARQLEPDRAEIDYALGTALLEAGRPGDAVPHLRTALDARVSGATAAELARALAASGKREGALAVLRRDVDAQRDAASWLAAGQVAFELQAPELAEQLVRKSLSVDPNQPGAHQQLGMALALSGRLKDAIAELTTAAEQSPRDPAVRLNLAVTYARARQFIAALDAR